MALRPSLAPLMIAGSPESAHTLEFFWDYVCPYSAKSARAVDSIVKPLLQDKYPGQVKIIVRPHPQPWHSSSTLVHEAGLAVAKVAPDAYWSFSLALFNAQEEYYDVPTSTQTPNEIRTKLVQLAKTSAGLTDEQVEKLREMLTLKTDGGAKNGGVGVTDDLKLCIKYSRQNSIHVSPTVVWNGLIANDVSSSWGEKDWSEFFSKNVK